MSLSMSGTIMDSIINSSEDDVEDSLVKDKGGLIAGIFVMTLIASFIPWFLKGKVTKIISIVSIMTCLSAGVIIGAAFNHMLPDASEEFALYMESVDPENKYADFPFASTITILTMFLLIAVDKVLVSGGLDGSADHNHMDLSQHNHPSRHAAGEIDLNVYSSNGIDDHQVTKSGADDAEDQQNNNDIENGNGHIHNHKKEKKEHGHGHGNKKNEEKEEHGHSHTHNHESHSHKDEKNEQVNISADGKSRARAWVFLIALSIHSIFDGLGLGSETEKDGFYGLLIAVLAHKFLDGLVLGIAIKFAYFPFLFSSIAITFAAAMTPLGIGIGMAISSVYSNSIDAYLVKGIILSITCGSFIYISLIELLPSGLCSPGWVKTKLAAAFVGWSVMAMLALFV